MEKAYPKFHIAWRTEPTKQQEEEIASRLEFFLPKLQKYSQLMRKDAADDALISIMIHHSRKDPYRHRYDFWYDDSADAFGLYVLDPNDDAIAMVLFPEDVGL